MRIGNIAKYVNEKLSLKKLHMTSLEKRIMKDIAEYERRSIEEGKFFLLTSNKAKKIFSDKNVSQEGKKYLYELYKEWDEIGSIPLELGKEMERLIEDPTVQLGIHRTGSGQIDNDNVTESELLNSIFSEGLRNYGDASSGSIRVRPNPNKTLSSLSSIETAVILMKSTYRDSKGGILAVFPSDLVNSELAFTDSSKASIIYEGDHHIKPEYLLGYVAQDNGVCTYHPKDEFKQTKTM